VRVPGPDFGPAAQRHLNDADLLHQHGRFANACHLAGLAAECALKAVAIAFLGVQPKTIGAPTVVINGTETQLSHLPTLWANMSLLITGRQGSMFASLLQGPNPFAAWSIHERYHRGDLITAARSDDHVAAARRIVDLHLQARLAGTLP
jgi:hypothetical protein